MALMIVRATKETTAGSFPGSPAAGTQKNLRLPSDNAFAAEPAPQILDVRDAAGSNRVVQKVLGRYTTNGSLRTHWWFSQSGILIPWAVTLSGSPLNPYTMAFDQAKQLEDGSGTLLYRRFLGAMCSKMTLAASSGSPLANLDFDFSYRSVASITVTDLPTPALSAYPTDSPVVFQLFAGGLTVGSSRTNFRDISLEITNTLDVMYDESRYPQTIKWTGQDVSLRIGLRHKTNTDRAALEALTSSSAILVATDGVNTGTFTFPAGYITSLADSFPLGPSPYQALGFDATLDPTTGVLVSYAQTP